MTNPALHWHSYNYTTCYMLRTTRGEVSYFKDQGFVHELLSAAQPQSSIAPTEGHSQDNVSGGEVYLLTVLHAATY